MSKTRPYKELLSESLSDPAQAKHYLKAVLEDYPEGFLKALGNVARANQVSKVAETAGVQRESVYRALSDNGNPTWDTLVGIVEAVGLKFTVLTVDEDPYSSEQVAAPIIETVETVETLSAPWVLEHQAVRIIFGGAGPAVAAKPYQMQSDESFGCLGVKIPSVIQPLPQLSWITGKSNGHR